MSDPLYRGSYKHQAQHLCHTAATNPATPCWRCGRPLHQHTNHKTGKPPRWTAGHIDDIQLAHTNGATIWPIEGRAVAAEASTCNYEAGTIHGNTLRVTLQPTRRW